MNLQKNQIIDIDVIDCNMLGFGVAKHQGAVIFIQKGVPGDKAKIRIIKCAKNYYVARIEELLVASPSRIDHFCNVHTLCGGCVFQRINYELEKSIKKEYVISCLRKEGLNSLNVLDVLSNNKISGYRNKIQIPVGLDTNGRVVAGFYSQKSHRIAPVDTCMIQHPSFASIVRFICDYLTKYNISIYSEEEGKGLVRHIYCRVGVSTNEIMVCLVLSQDNFPNEKQFIKEITSRFGDIKSIVFNINPNKTNVILGQNLRTVWGKECIRDILCNKSFDISPLAFYQVNHDTAELLYRRAYEMADIKKYDLLIDLYCGIGTIGICAADSIPITGIEIIPEAVNDAVANAALNQISNADYRCGDALKELANLDHAHQNPLIILDPPRKGLESQLIEILAKHRFNDILYISCAADTLSRDLKHFYSLGYHSDCVQPVDMFPRTGHVESICFLTRN